MGLKGFEKLDMQGARVLTTRLPADGPAPHPQAGGDGGPASKYRNVATVHGGIRFDSKAEADRARYLDSLAPAGIWYVRQPTFRLGCPENVYRADFLVVVPGKGVHVEDVKGFATAKFLRDLKLWEAYGPCELWVISKGKLARVVPGKTRD